LKRVVDDVAIVDVEGFVVLVDVVIAVLLRENPSWGLLFH